MNHRSFHNLVESINISELTVRIVDTVTMVLLGYFREVDWLCAIVFHMLNSSVAEKPGGKWAVTLAIEFLVDKVKLCERGAPITERSRQGTPVHFLESQGQCTFNLPCRHCLVALIERCAARSTGIIYIYDGYARNACPINSSLTRGCIS